MATTSNISGDWKLGHRVALVGNRQHVVDHPDPSQVDEGVQAGGAHGKDGHGLGGPGDRISPPGPEQMQDGGNQRA
jgi:hypothetical protein